jgi:hypothetical protein
LGWKKIHTLHQQENNNWSITGFMVFNDISKIFHLYRGGQFYWWRKPEYPEKTTNLSLTTFITYGLYIAHNIVIYGMRTHNVSGDI